MREDGGGHVLCLNVENLQTADPLYDASRAAMRVILQRLSHELSGEGIRASEVRLEDQGRVGPERCAESVRRLLANPPDDSSRGGFTLQRVSGA
jgi:NAD(P)-dependent dehydrogenase (short-subunit alcohol dehydrogenase family)